MQSIMRDYPQFSYAVLYVREAHPGAIIPAHKTFEDKKNCAAKLSIQDGDNRTILVDGIW